MISTCSLLTWDILYSVPKKAKPAFPSGLVNNWQAKATASKSKAPSGKSKAVPKSDNEQIGGLADEDAFAEAPAPLRKSRNKNRNNDVSPSPPTASLNLIQIGDIACCIRNH
jgi:hypothetical protein